MVLAHKGRPDGELGTRQFYVARLREEGCDVEWQGSGDGGSVSRVITPRTAMSHDKRDRIFWLVIGLVEVNSEPEFELQVQDPVLR